MWQQTSTFYGYRRYVCKRIIFHCNKRNEFKHFMVKNCKRTLILEIAVLSAIFYDYTHLFSDHNEVYASKKMASMLWIKTVRDEKYSTVFETLLITYLYFVLNTYNFISIFEHNMAFFSALNRMLYMQFAKINYIIFDFMMLDMHASDTSILCRARFNQFSINYKTMGHFMTFFYIFFKIIHIA